jgi:hypothetical protein
MQDIGHAQRAPHVAAKLPERESGFRAEVIRALEATGHRQIRARAIACDFAELQHLPGAHLDCGIQRQRGAVQAGLEDCARQCDVCTAIEAQGRPIQRDLQSRRIRAVVQQAIGESQ